MIRRNRHLVQIPDNNLTATRRNRAFHLEPGRRFDPIQIAARRAHSADSYSREGARFDLGQVTLEKCCYVVLNSGGFHETPHCYCHCAGCLGSRFCHGQRRMATIAAGIRQRRSDHPIVALALDPPNPGRLRKQALPRS